jgi:hypothetical protein
MLLLELNLVPSVPQRCIVNDTTCFIENYVLHRSLLPTMQH